MIFAGDLVHLPYTPDLTEAGILCTRRLVPHLAGPGRAALYDGFVRSVAATALEIAFRRYLGLQGIPFHVRPATPFSTHIGYDVEVDRRRCRLESFLISRKSQIAALSRDPTLALRASALVPLDRYMAEPMRSDDVFVFGLVSAAVNEAPSVRHPDVPEGRAMWFHIMTKSWFGLGTSAPLGEVILRSASQTTTSLGFGGEDMAGHPIEAQLDIVPGRATRVSRPMRSLTHLVASRKPSARIEIVAPAGSLRHQVDPPEWRNVWLAGTDICLLGWITHEQFRAQARLLPEGRRTFQFSRTKTKNLCAEASRLRPMRELIERSRVK